MKVTTFRSVSLLVAGAALGVVTAGALSSAFAAGDNSGTASTSTSAAAAPGDHDGKRGPGGGHAGEKALTGANLAKATAAATKAESGGKVDRAETDSGDATYEVHMTKSNGDEVTVKLDNAFAVTGAERGMGK